MTLPRTWPRRHVNGHRGVEPIHLPALVELTRQLEASSQPKDMSFTVTGDLFDRAKIEMYQVMQARGFPLPYKPQPFPFENFVFNGIVILASD